MGCEHKFKEAKKKSGKRITAYLDVGEWRQHLVARYLYICKVCGAQRWRGY